MQTSEWLFKVKVTTISFREVNGDTKAQVVTRGFPRVHGMAYSEKLAPVVRVSSIPCLLAPVAYLTLEIHQMDEVTGFLRGGVKEDLSVEVLDGAVGVE